MTQYINKAAVVAEIDRLQETTMDENRNFLPSYHEGVFDGLSMLESFLDTLEVKELDLDKLGEIARHLIAVKEHIEDMRLDKEEWLILEKIGYPERFKAQKGE